MSQAYHQLPSDIYKIEGYQDAFAFDRAVWLFGSHIEAELKACNGKTDNEINSKRLRVMQKYFPQGSGASGKTKKFADPAKRST